MCFRAILVLCSTRTESKKGIFKVLGPSQACPTKKSKDPDGSWVNLNRDRLLDLQLI